MLNVLDKLFRTVGAAAFRAPLADWAPSVPPMVRDAWHAKNAHLSEIEARIKWHALRPREQKRYIDTRG